MAGSGVAGGLDSEIAEAGGFEGYIDGRKNTGTRSHQKRDVATAFAGIDRCIAACGSQGEMALVCRHITAHTVSLIREMGSHNGTEASMKAVADRAIWLLGEVMIGREQAEELGIERENATTAAMEDVASLRCYRPAEIAELEMLRDMIAGIQSRGTRLIGKMDEKIRAANATIYDCTTLIGHVESTGDAERGNVTEGSSASMEIISAAGPRSMAVLRCSSQMRLRSTHDLLGCMNREIAKGEETDTYPAFYLSVFERLHLILRTVNGLDDLAVARTRFDYGDPLARRQGN